MLEGLFTLMAIARFNKKELLVENNTKAMKEAVQTITKTMEMIGVSGLHYTIKFDVEADMFDKTPHCRVYLQAR